MWNNLLLPYGQKKTNFRPDTPFLCPNRRFPYLATAKNSGYSDPSSSGREDAHRWEDELSGDFWRMVNENGMDQCPL